MSALISCSSEILALCATLHSEKKLSYEWMNEWMNQWMDGWMDEWMNAFFEHCGFSLSSIFSNCKHFDSESGQE